jgi:hypothetical protein
MLFFAKASSKSKISTLKIDECPFVRYYALSYRL